MLKLKTILNEIAIDNDTKAAKKAGITLDQLATLRSLKRDQTVGLKTPEEIDVIKRGGGWTTKSVKSIQIMGLDEKDLSVDFRYKGSGAGRSFTAKEMFNLTKLKVLKYEDPDKNIDVVPTAKDLKSMVKIADMEYGYSPGGFPTSARYVINPKKAEQRANKIKTRDEIIRIGKAVVGTFGAYKAEPFIQRAHKIGASAHEIASIEDYKPRYELDTGFKNPF